MRQITDHVAAAHREMSAIERPARYARNSAGKPVVKDFEPAPETAAPSGVAESVETNDNEVKLF